MKRLPIALAFVLSVAAAAIAEPTTQPALNDAPYVNKENAYEIRLPKDWQLKKGIEDPGFEAPTKDEDGKFRLAPNIVFNVTNVTGIKPADLETVIEAKRKQYAKIFPEYHETEDQKLTINGIDAHFFGGTFNTQGLIARMRQVWIIIPGRIYIITCTSIASAWDKNVPLFEASENTFKVTQ